MPVEPNHGAGGPVGGVFSLGVGVLCIGFVGEVDFFPEKLVK